MTITVSCFAALPDSIGRLTGLRKLMLAGNRLTSLPDSLQRCRELELVRISANRLRRLPAWLLALPRLAWLAYAGNPLETVGPHSSSEADSDIRLVPWSELEMGERVGEGASGVVQRAWWRAAQREVAVKLFKGDTTSDGLPEHEMKVCLCALRSLLSLTGEYTRRQRRWVCTTALSRCWVGSRARPPTSWASCSHCCRPASTLS